jgi:hypothetical protein
MRLEQVEVAAAAPAAAAATYNRNFGFQAREAKDGAMIVQVGGAEIRLRPAGVDREGLSAIRLATDDLRGLIEALRRAGIEPESAEAGAIRIPPRFTGNVPLIVVERKA